MTGEFSDEHKLAITESLLRANARMRGEDGWAVRGEVFDALLDNRLELRGRIGHDSAAVESPLMF
jgi:hypothetical protein